jgi:Ca2+-binding RTX toxin-like protein
MEACEGRVLCAGNPGAKDLYVYDSPGNDVIEMNLLPGPKNTLNVMVKANDTKPQLFTNVGAIYGLAGVGNDKLIIVEHGNAPQTYVVLVGGPGDDTLIGSEGDDVLDGGDGNDVVYGLGGNDYFMGGNGNDHYYGGFGDDFFDAWGTGVKFIEGGFGNDVIFTYPTNGLDGSGADYYNTGGTYFVYGETANDKNTPFEHDELYILYNPGSPITPLFALWDVKGMEVVQPLQVFIFSFVPIV